MLSCDLIDNQICRLANFYDKTNSPFPKSSAPLHSINKWNQFAETLAQTQA